MKAPRDDRRRTERALHDAAQIAALCPDNAPTVMQLDALLSKVHHLAFSSAMIGEPGTDMNASPKVKAAWDVLRAVWEVLARLNDYKIAGSNVVNIEHAMVARRRQVRP